MRVENLPVHQQFESVDHCSVGVQELAGCSDDSWTCMRCGRPSIGVMTLGLARFRESL